MAGKKTLAMKLLDGKKVPYEVFEYPETMRDASAVAGILGIPAAELFKTLVVVRPPARPILVMIPSDRQLDLKQLAHSLGLKKLSLATQAEAEALTGLQVGGISALALLNRGFTILLDEAAGRLERITISGGQKGINLRLAVAELVRVTGARWVKGS